MRWELEVRDPTPFNLWHPHHLIFTPLALALFHLLKLFGYAGRLYGAMTALDALLGAAGFLLAYRTLRRSSVERGLALAGALALAFCYGFWSFANNAESVILATVAPLAAGALMPWACSCGFRRWALVALVAGAAVWAHIANVLLFPFVAAAFLFGKPKRWLGGVVALAALFALPAVAGYAVVGFGLLKLPSFAALQAWVVGGPGHESYTTFALKNIILDLYAFGRCVVGIRWLKDAMLDGWTTGRVAVAALNGVAVLAFAAAFLLALARVFRQPPARRRGWLALALLAPYALYFTFRDAGAYDRWVIQLAAVILFIYATLGVTAGRWKRALLGALPVCLFLANFIGSAYPESREDNNEHVAFVRFLGRYVHADDVVITSGLGGPGAGLYAEYFLGAKPLTIYYDGRDANAFREKAAWGRLEWRQTWVVDDRPAITSTPLLAPGEAERYAVTGDFARRLFEPDVLDLRAIYTGYRYKPSRIWRLRPDWFSEPF